MQIFFIVLIIGLVLFLFRLYHLGNDDYVLVKKNVSLEQVFNCALFCSFVALLFARAFYVVFNPLPIYLNILGFVLFPYFPGLSLVGGLLGGAGALYFYARRNKFPLGRIFDFFSMSFIFVLPIGLVGYFLLSRDITVGGIVKLALFSLFSISANIFLYPKAPSLEMKEGTSSILFLIFFSLVMLLTSAIDHPGISYFVHHTENFVELGILIVSIILILRQEIIGRIR